MDENKETSVDRTDVFISPAYELKVGDIILSKDKVWGVQSINGDFGASFVNLDSKDNESGFSFWGNWKDKLTEQGYSVINEDLAKAHLLMNGHGEYIPVTKEQKAEARAEKRRINKIDPNQLTLFGDEQPDEPEKDTDTNKPPFIHQAVIDNILSHGGNEKDSVLRIVAQYQKGLSVNENAEFLKNEFGKQSGRGHIVYGNKYAVWFYGDGMKINAGDSAITPQAVTVSWEQAAERIGELLEQGTFTTQENLDKAWDYEIKLRADQIWYLGQDCEDGEGGFIQEMRKGGFPDDTAKIAEKLKDPHSLQQTIDNLAEFADHYDKDRDILRFHHYNPRELLFNLEDLQNAPVKFTADKNFNLQSNLFITEDEKQNVILSGDFLQRSKDKIRDFFRENSKPSEQENFIKSSYSSHGGRHGSGYDKNCTAKGITLSRSYQQTFGHDVHDYKDYDKVILSWKDITFRTNTAIESGRYIDVFSNSDFYMTPKEHLELMFDNICHSYVNPFYRNPDTEKRREKFLALKERLLNNEQGIVPKIYELLKQLNGLGIAGYEYQRFEEAEKEYNLYTKTRRVADIFNLDEILLRELVKQNPSEADLNVFGQFDKVVGTIDKAKAKEYFEKRESAELSTFTVAAKTDKLLREFVLNPSLVLEIIEEKAELSEAEQTEQATPTDTVLDTKTEGIILTQPVINKFTDSNTLLYAISEDGVLFISNGGFIIRAAESDINKIAEQINGRHTENIIEPKEFPRLLMLLDNAKGNFELSENPYVMKSDKDSSYIYADNKQYFQYFKSDIDVFQFTNPRMFVDDNSSYDIRSHNLIVKDQNGGILGAILPVRINEKTV